MAVFYRRNVTLVTAQKTVGGRCLAIVIRTIARQKATGSPATTVIQGHAKIYEWRAVHLRAECALSRTIGKATSNLSAHTEPIGFPSPTCRMNASRRDDIVRKPRTQWMDLCIPRGRRCSLPRRPVLESSEVYKLVSAFIVDGVRVVRIWILNSDVHGRHSPRTHRRGRT